MVGTASTTYVTPITKYCMGSGGHNLLRTSHRIRHRIQCRSPVDFGVRSHQEFREVSLGWVCVRPDKCRLFELIMTTACFNNN